jgi:hypothetical protein
MIRASSGLRTPKLLSTLVHIGVLQLITSMWTTSLWAAPDVQSVIETRADVFESLTHAVKAPTYLNALPPIDRCAEDKKKVTAIEVVRELNRKLVNECALSSQNKTIDVIEEHKYLCRVEANGTPVYTYPTARYRLSTSGPFRIKIGKHLAFYDEEKNPLTQNTKLEFLAAAQECASNIRAMFRNYDIDIDLTFSWDQMPLDATTYKSYPSHRILITKDAWARQWSDHFVMADSKIHRNECGNTATNEAYWSCILIRKDNFCHRMAHEVGHMLGFPDEYPDPAADACPDRTFEAPIRESEPYSVMDDDQHEWEKLAFYPRHIAKLIEPLCADKKHKNNEASLSSYLSELLLPLPITEERVTTFCKGANSLFLNLPISSWPEDVFKSTNGIRAASCSKIEDPEFTKKVLAADAKNSVLLLDLFLKHSQSKRTKGNLTLPDALQKAIVRDAGDPQLGLSANPASVSSMLNAALSLTIDWNCNELQALLSEIVSYGEQNSIRTIIQRSNFVNCLNRKSHEKLTRQPLFVAAMKNLVKNPKTRIVAYEASYYHPYFGNYIDDDIILNSLNTPDKKENVSAASIVGNTSACITKTEDLKQIIIKATDAKFSIKLARSMIGCFGGPTITARREYSAFFKDLMDQQNAPSRGAGIIGSALLAEDPRLLAQTLIEKFSNSASDAALLAQPDVADALAQSIAILNAKVDLDLQNKALKLMAKSPTVLLPLAIKTIDKNLNSWKLEKLEFDSLAGVFEVGSRSPSLEVQKSIKTMFCKVKPNLRLGLTTRAPLLATFDCTKH